MQSTHETWLPSWEGKGWVHGPKAGQNWRGGSPQSSPLVPRRERKKRRITALLSSTEVRNWGPFRVRAQFSLGQAGLQARHNLPQAIDRAPEQSVVLLQLLLSARAESVDFVCQRLQEPSIRSRHQREQLPKRRGRRLPRNRSQFLAAFLPVFANGGDQRHLRVD